MDLATMVDDAVMVFPAIYPAAQPLVLTSALSPSIVHVGTGVAAAAGLELLHEVKLMTNVVIARTNNGNINFFIKTLL
jgi:hypothetical protein